jgi:hypothetical protein
VHETVAPEQVTEATALEPTVEPDKSTGNTFAAAAAVSSAVSRVTNASEVESEPRINSEAAAAWKNWEQIRDSVMSPQQASDIAESLAQAAKAVAPPPAETASEDHSAPALEGAALASIVDTVLAELKPKLMEEIAKKLKR